MTIITMPSQKPIKALLTDVFGTVVDWRSTVLKYLPRAASAKLNDPCASLASMVRVAVDVISWPDFVQEWRSSYFQFTRSYDPETMDFKPIDQHHLESLIELVKKYQIEGLWTIEELEEISLIWHFLEPWPDSSPGIATLSKTLKVGTLSNGGQSLLQDLVKFGNLAYTDIISAEDFKAYKPHASVYLGGCSKIGVSPEECAMVATHLPDLDAARQHGMQTIYIERDQEETWPEEKVNEAKSWVDMWIKVDEGGFIELARRLGID